MSMKRQLAAIRSAFEASGIAQEKLRTLDDHVAWLRSSGAAAQAAAVGEVAPEFELKTQDGTHVSLKNEWAAGPCVLTWIRGSW